MEQTVLEDLFTWLSDPIRGFKEFTIFIFTYPLDYSHYTWYPLLIISDLLLNWG
jgi:hypothetical protein